MTPGRPAAALLVAAVLLAAACGPATSSASPSQSPSPGATGSADPGASGSARPKPTGWPGNVVLAIEALGVSNGEIMKAIADFGAAVGAEDLALMRRAADGLAGIDILMENVDDIEAYEPMRSLADKYRIAVPLIDSAAEDLRAAIDAGNASEITSASRRLTEGLTAYIDLQPELADWVNQSIELRRLLLL